MPTTDFLLIKTGNNKFSLREVPSIYTAGQLQPLTEVPTPNSRLSNQYQKNRLAAYLFRQFLKKENPSHKLKYNQFIILTKTNPFFDYIFSFVYLFTFFFCCCCRIQDITAKPNLFKPSTVSVAVKTFTKIMEGFNKANKSDNENNSNNNNASTSNNNNNTNNINNAKKLLSKLSPSTITLLHTVCSSLKSPSGPILKFSEIFTPRLHEIQNKRRVRMALPEPELNDDNVESEGI